MQLTFFNSENMVNPLKTSPEYTQAGIYGKCMLKQSQIVFNGLNNAFQAHLSNFAGPSDYLLSFF